MLKQGVVGVDRACSGVQSLQASLMLALFAGEWFRLSTSRRIALVVSGFCLALLMNLWRVISLTRLVSVEGAGAIDRHHDRIGAWATMLLCSLMLALGCLMRRPTREFRKTALHAPGWWIVRGASGLLLLMIFIAIPINSQSWMKRISSAGETISHPAWELTGTNLPEGWSAQEGRFSDAELQQLRFSEGKIMKLMTGDGNRAEVVHMFWTPEITVPEGVYSHRPEICMPSAGWKQDGDPVPLVLKHRGGDIHGGTYGFTKQFSQRAVFHAMWYGGQPRPVSGQLEAGESRLDRLSLLWKSPGRRSHEVITVFMDGEADLGVLKKRLETVLGAVLARHLE